ncbi:MAG: UvrD-helicase domain-containing protein, partial [Bacteroidetes bacterium]|nr:UvrD-helicase domain-containing protein [Bacteroidota bacterium]
MERNSKQAEKKPAPDESARRIIRGHADLVFPVSADPDLDLDSNMIISAGAGSGKTTALIERLVALIRAGRRPEELVAITFTRKAAGELQERFFSGLLGTRETLRKRVLEEGGAWEEELERVESALQRSEETFIGTIHSFCALILRRFSVAAGIPPDFRQVEEADELTLRQAFWRSALARKDGNPTLELLRDAEIPDEALHALFSLCVEQEGVDFPLSGVDAPDFAAHVDPFLPVLHRLAARLPHTGKPDEFMLAVQRAALSMAHGLPTTDAQRGHVMDLFLAGVKRSQDCTLRLKVTYWGGKGEPLRTLADNLNKGC